MVRMLEAKYPHLTRAESLYVALPLSGGRAEHKITELLLQTIAASEDNRDREGKSAARPVGVAPKTAPRKSVRVISQSTFLFHHMPQSSL